MDITKTLSTMNDKKAIIRDKWIRHTPLLKLSDCVDGAMSEYARQECIAFVEWLRVNDYYPVDKSDKPNWIQIGSKKGWLQPGKSIIITSKQLYDQYLIDTENKKL